MSAPDIELELRRGADGSAEFVAGGRVYVRVAPGRRSFLFEGGTVDVEEQPAGHALLRTVRGAGAAAVVEQHGFDAAGRPVVVDGVRLQRDAQGRITAAGAWRYRYAGARLAQIEGPHGQRTIEHGADGRPLRVDGRVLRYDHAGRRADLSAAPAGLRRDGAGRVRAELGALGEIVRFWLWDGPLCLARVDGPPGAPLAAAFTHDASATPIRILRPEGSVAITRDAFGEALLQHAGVPGLYGGFVAGGVVHLRDRVLDPRTGSWDRPDPWDGSPGDPRRARLGRAAPLPVERQAAGAWAVSRHDPVGRADPTGAMSFPLLLVSDLTHSSSNNLLGVFGLDLTINFWASLLTGVPGRFFNFDTASAPSGSGAWGILRDGRIAPENAVTYQHLVFVQPAPLHALADVRMVDPGGRFVPSLYGSALRVAPAGGGTFTLAGAVSPYPGASSGLGWSRAGGTGEAVVPGSRQPWFPSGALHLDAARTGLRVDSANLTELRAAGVPAQGTVVAGGLLVMTVGTDQAPAASTGTDVAELLVVTGLTAPPPVAVTRLMRPVNVTPDGDSSRVELEPEPGEAFDGSPRIRGLSSAEPAVTLNAGSTPRRLTGPFGAASWAAGEPVRLAQGGVAVGAATIVNRVAHVALDAALPAGTPVPVAVHRGVPGATTFTVTLATDGRSVDFASPTDRLPSATPVVVTAGAGAPVREAAVLGADVGAKGRQLDHALTLAPGTVMLRTLGRGERLGEAAAIGATADLTYAPDRFGALAGAEPLWLEPSAGAVAARVGTPVSEELVFDRDLPGVAGTQYAAELLHIGSLDLGQVALEPLTTIDLDAPTSLSDPVELHVWTTTAPAMTAAPRLAGAALPTRERIFAAGAPTKGLRPGQLVMVKGSGAAIEVACVRRVALAVTTNRDVGVSDLVTAVRLVTTGPRWTGEWQGAARLTVRPLLAAPAATAPTLPVEMPRLRAGELVRVVTGGATSDHRIAGDPAGTTLVLDPPPGTGPPAGAPCTVQRLEAQGETGRPWCAVNGRRASATRFTFDVWDSGDLTAALAIGIAHGAQTEPVTIASVDELTLELTAPLPGSIGAPVDVDVAPIASVEHPTSAVTRGKQVIVDTTLLPSANLVSVVPLAAVGDVRPVGLGSGTVRIPTDLGKELGRREALIEHELRHMTQSAMWGPLLLGFLPLFLLEAGLDQWSDIELPKWTPYGPGTISTEGGRRVVKIDAPEGFETDSKVQVVQANGAVSTVALGARLEDGRFAALVSAAVADGPVQMRRSKNSGPWEGVIDVLQTLTVGGALNLLAGGVWGGLVSLFGHLGHLLSRWASTSDDLHPAEVYADGLALRLAGADLAALRGAADIVVRLGDAQAVRRVSTVLADGYTLSAALPAGLSSGHVEVARFSAEDPASNWDWREWFPANVPDPARPARVEVHPRSGVAPPAFAPHDRVAVRVGTVSVDTHVTVVGTNGTIELVEMPGRGGSEVGDVLVARLAADDPLGSADDAALDVFRQGWMRWMFNPYGQIQYRTQPKPGSAGHTLLRVLRYALSSSSWSVALLGYYFLDNARVRLLESGGHLSQMEQDASSHSGDLYTTIGMLGIQPEIVGDIGTYWLFESSREWTSVMATQGDSSGTHIEPYARLQPNRTPEAAEGVTPADLVSRDTMAGPLAGRPGDALPDELVGNKVADNPFDAPTAAREFTATARASIPQSAGNERVNATYFAFCRPPASTGEPHRITPKGLNHKEDGKHDREAHEREVQVILHDLSVSDVMVHVGGVEVGERADATLLVGQVADVSVDPSGDGRDYATTVADPAGGPLLIAAARPMRLEAGVAAAGPEPVEVSRRYAVAADGSAAHPSLVHGVHLGGDIHVPVRRFTVTVVTTLTLRGAPDLSPDHVLDGRDADHTALLRPGASLFVLVPATVLTPLAAVTLEPSYPAAPADATFARPGLLVTEVTAQARADPFVAAHLGVAGVAYRVTLDADRPPEEPATWNLATAVGAAGALLTTTIALTPHFTLAVPAAGRQVRRGTPITLTSDGPDVDAASAALTPPDGVGVAVTGKDVTLTVAATAALGTRLVSVAAGDGKRARRTIEIVA